MSTEDTDVHAENRRTITVVADINFDRVTSISTGGPPAPGDAPAPTPTLEFGAEIEPLPWYSGPC
jgi:hypothetical protein